jgi:hypothetical protein
MKSVSRHFLDRVLDAAIIPVPPWREESTPQTTGNELSTDWIPAFAGMTGVA